MLGAYIFIIVISPSWIDPLIEDDILKGSGEITKKTSLGD